MTRQSPRKTLGAAPAAPCTKERSQVEIIRAATGAGKSYKSLEILAPLGPEKGLDWGDIGHDLIDSVVSKASTFSPLPEIARVQMRAVVKDFLRKRGYPSAFDEVVVENIIDELLGASATSRR